MGLVKDLEIIVKAFIFVSVSVVVLGDTVHFTNSQTQIERVDYGTKRLKSYQLEVPGSSPITIIEADPIKSAENQGSQSFDSRDNAGREYGGRKTKDYVVPGSSHQQDEKSKNNQPRRCFGSKCDNFKYDSAKKTVYSPDLLNKFLKEYAEKIMNADQKTKDVLKKLEITTSKYDLYSGDKMNIKMSDKIDRNDDRRFPSWSEDVGAKKQKHPYDENEGWVALDAVPWTRSKISKWQSNAYKVTKPNSFNSYNDNDSPQYVDRYPSNYGRPDQEYQFESKPSTSHHQKPNLFNNRPDFEADPEDNERPFELPRPWDKFSTNRYQYNSNSEQKHHRPDCDQEHHQHPTFEDGNRKTSNKYYENGGIITDGRPGDFPTSGSSYRQKDFKKPTEVVYADAPSDHPLSHPSNGNGQWVLLSTTKGYKIPKIRQRSLSITPDSMLSHRSVRLTVLPAVDNSKENMTLSHGGLLEVEPSFNTVDESKRIYDRSTRSNSTRLRPNKNRKVMATNPTPDGSAVMAAVGAGLVPATVAMIMPMVLGRKKRSTISPYSPLYIDFYANVTQQPHLDFESTIQRSL